jgi:hypothetical protein
MFPTDKVTSVAPLLAIKSATQVKEALRDGDLAPYGVTLVDIADFMHRIKKIKGIYAFNNKTMKQVAREYVTFLTAGRMCAFTKLLATERGKEVRLSSHL